MSTFKVKFLCCSVFFGLLTASLTSQAQQTTDYSQETLLKFAEKNRLNHVVLISLHFCPNWYESLYTSQFNQIDSNTRIVAKKTDGVQVILNPKGEGVGWSTNNLDLTKIDELTAKRNWGAKGNKDGTYTCDLITSLGSPEKEIYHLDLKFTDKNLSSYRLRGTGILGSSNWVKL